MACLKKDEVKVYSVWPSATQIHEWASLFDAEESEPEAEDVNGVAVIEFLASKCTRRIVVLKERLYASHVFKYRYHIWGGCINHDTEEVDRTFAISAPLDDLYDVLHGYVPDPTWATFATLTIINGPYTTCCQEGN